MYDILCLYVVIPIFKAIAGLILFSVISAGSFLSYFALFPYVFCDSVSSHYLVFVKIMWNWDKHIFFQREFTFTSDGHLGTINLGLPSTF